MVYYKFLIAVVLISISNPLSAKEPAPEAASPPQTEYVLSRKCAVYMAAAGVSAGAFSVLALPYALSFVGFTTAGIAGGSLAAAWQATMGGVVAGGSLFAILQAISVAGLGWSGTALISGTSATAAAAFCEWINIEEGKN
jgi:hypothetical protein